MCQNEFGNWSVEGDRGEAVLVDDAVIGSILCPWRSVGTQKGEHLAGERDFGKRMTAVWE